MKTKIFLLFVLLSCSKVLFANECKWDNIDRVVILYSDWDLLTDIPISGPDFYQIAKKKFSITETEGISAFKNEMGNLSQFEDTNIDVRCKVLFYSGCHIEETFCITRRSVLYRGLTYEASQELFSLINEIIATHCYSNPVVNECPIYRNEVATPTDLLTKGLSRIFDSEGDSPETREIRIIAVCKVDISGNTVDASVYYKPSLKDNCLKEKIKKYLIEILKWTENPERCVTDKNYYSILLNL